MDSLVELGHAHFPGILDQRALGSARSTFDQLDVGAGQRLSEPYGFKSLLSNRSPIGQLAERLLGVDARPVRLILFDKTDEQNWSVGWHQDRVIAVRERHDIAGYGHWTVKDGVPHVKPPIELLERMLTFRIHLDPVTPTNAPLKVIDGSHRIGAVSKHDVSRHVANGQVAVCLAQAGDVWVYSTPILHASNPNESGMRRRVIQVDYAMDDPGQGLDWAFPHSA